MTNWSIQEHTAEVTVDIIWSWEQSLGNPSCPMLAWTKAIKRLWEGNTKHIDSWSWRSKSLKKVFECHGIFFFFSTRQAKWSFLGVDLDWVLGNPSNDNWQTNVERLINVIWDSEMEEDEVVNCEWGGMGWRCTAYNCGKRGYWRIRMGQLHGSGFLVDNLCMIMMSDCNSIMNLCLAIIRKTDRLVNMLDLNVTPGQDFMRRIKNLRWTSYLS